MRKTIQDVAKAAGVAPSTVSYVLSGNRSISPETQARVQKSIRALKYRPHAGARAMRAGRTDVIALVVPFHTWTHERSLMRFVYSVADAARAHGWNVMLLTAADGKAEIERVVRSNMVDGLILMEVGLRDERVPLLAGLGQPAALLGAPEDPAGLPCVDFDFEEAAHLCVEHMVGLGHREIGFIGPPQGVYDGGVGFALRTHRGVSDKLAEHGLAFHSVAAEPNLEGAHVALRSLFGEAPKLTALVVNNEGVLDLVVEGVRQLGKKVPRDISIVAIARDEIALQVTPPLTYVGVPADDLGRRAVELLASQRGQESGAVLLPPTLVRRGSDSAPIRARKSH
ncbi:MAG TPA: LacI family DNA-binding transcriptional regulator [Acidimicrobiales bacterium]|nr:LacI family DNA-binding transcriptional regulator [Acidimicrobiales bacterium]